MRWHILRGGKRFVLSTADVRDQIASGTLSPDSLVWTDGLSSWEPLSAHFGDSGRAPNKSERRSTLLAAVEAAGVLLVGLLGWIFLWRLSNIESPVPTVAILLGLLCGAGVLLVRMWKRVRGHPGNGMRVLAIVCGLSVVFQTVLTGSAVYHLPTLLRVEAAAKRFANYDLRADKTNHRAILVGPIGDGIRSKLGRLWQSVGPIEVLEINSHGGMVREALDLASFIEEKRIVVVARENCDSACIIVLVAGAKSYADADLQLGMHAVSSLVDSDSELVQFATDIGSTESSNFLIAHGIPKELIERASRVDAGDLLYVPAQRLVDDGAIDGLMDGWSIVYP